MSWKEISFGLRRAMSFDLNLSYIYNFLLVGDLIIEFN